MYFKINFPFSLTPDIFTVALYETESDLPDGRKCNSETSKKRLQNEIAFTLKPTTFEEEDGELTTENVNEETSFGEAVDPATYKVSNLYMLGKFNKNYFVPPETLKTILKKKLLINVVAAVLVCSKCIAIAHLKSFYFFTFPLIG